MDLKNRKEVAQKRRIKKREDGDGRKLQQSGLSAEDGGGGGGGEGGSGRFQTERGDIHEG